MQQTFGSPAQLPPSDGILPSMWTDMMKYWGTKKSRFVCNGAPSKKVSVTLGGTYASSLDQTYPRVLYTAAAMIFFRLYILQMSATTLSRYHLPKSRSMSLSTNNSTSVGQVKVDSRCQKAFSYQSREPCRNILNHPSYRPNLSHPY